MSIRDASITARDRGKIASGAALAIFALALLVRLLMVLWSQTGPYVEAPTGMSSLYFRQGYAIAAGHGFVVGEGQGNLYLKEMQRRVESGAAVARPGAFGPAPPGIYPDTLHPPGMSILVATLHRLLEMPADIPLQLLGAILDSLAAVIVYWIATQVLGPRAALLSGMLYALFLPQAWAATGAQMPDGLIGPFIVAMLAAILVATSSTDWRAWRWYMLAGLALGLGSYLRPDYLLAPVAMFPFLWLFLRRFFTAAIGSILVLSVALALLSPWAYRNHSLFDRWIFTSSGAGATLVTGLGEFKNPWGFGPTDVDRHEEAARQGFRSAWVPEADQYFRQIWWQAIQDDPGAMAVAVAKRLPLGLAPPYSFGFDNPLKTQTFTDVREQGQDRYQIILSRPFYVLAAYWDVLIIAAFNGIALLASIYWLLTDRKRWRLILLLLSLHIYSIAIHLLIHMEPRFLLPSNFVLLFAVAWLLAEPRRVALELRPAETSGNAR